MTMGERIKNLRKQHGWSMEELGQRVGVERSAVNKWEKGHVENIKRSTIRNLSDTFGVSPAYLMCWEDSDNFAPTPAEDAALLAAYHSATPELQQAVRTILGV